MYERAMRAWQAGRPAEAESALRALLAAEPGHGEANHRLGLLLAQHGHAEAALAFLARAETLLGGRADVRINYASVCQHAGRLDEALRLLDAAQAAGARQPELSFNRGVVLQALERFTDAAESFGEARRSAPGWAEAWMSEGNCRLVAGEPEAAKAVLDEALGLHPGHPGVASNRLMALNYLSGLDLAGLLAGHREWGRTPAAGIPARASPRPPGPARRKNTNGPLRIGFLSPNLADHAVAYFLESWVGELDPARIESFAYALAPGGDAVTTRLRQSFGRWREAGHLDDAVLARRIADDRPDLLVDLAGHTANNRLRLFARRLAPVQVEMIGYPATTGLGAMDYFLTDATLDPPEEGGSAFVERLYRLPLFCAYRAPVDAPEPGALPMAETGVPTLGSFQSLAKLTDPTLDRWCALMRRVPGARLEMRALGGRDPRAVDALRRRFAARGVEPERVRLDGFDGFDAYLARHRAIDLCLDTWPWNGHTTTCHALWMGVPTLTVPGDRRAGRMGAALMRAVGLDRFVAASTDEFVEHGAALLADADALAAIRAGLRERVRTSLLCDGKAFADAFSGFAESAVRAAGAARDA